MSSGSTMTYGPQQSFVPVSIDLHSIVRRSVASLYSHLVTRPTGRALRLGIESQIVELGDRCLSVLDFKQVVILDYSCADEAVAKLVLRYLEEDRPADAYFVARGVSDHHLRTWLTSQSLAEYLDFKGRMALKNAREWARRAGVCCAHRGRTVLYLRKDVDRAIGAAHLEIT